MGTRAPFSAKHLQVFDSVHAWIRSGDYQPGDRIPSEAALVEEFGVSRPTVAKALRALQERGIVQRRRGSGTYVSEAKRDEKLFGLLIPGLGAGEIFEQICGEMARVAQMDGHSLLWGAVHGPNDNNGDNVDKGSVAWNLAQRFIRSHVAGVFFAPLELIPNKDEINRQVISAIDEAKIPVVLLDRDLVKYPGRSEHDLVGINNRRECHTISNYLFETGCRNLQFVLRPGSASTIQSRVAGFTEAFLTRRVPFNLNRVHECDPSDKRYIKRMLEEHEPDGIVCGNDVIAGHLLHTLDELGVRVPEDVSIGGMDDVKYASLLRVPLTTMRQPFAAIGETAYYVMLDRIARPHAAPRQVTLGCELVVRDSTRRP